MTHARRYGFALPALLAALSLTGVASADPSPREKAAAEALFQQATALIEEEKYAEACAKFEGSQELDPALGTMLRLADCYDRVGRSASAWALFHEAVAVASASNQSEREQIAAQRARDLEARLAKLSLNVPVKARVPGLRVLLNGVAIPNASWNGPLPVDPGPQKIEASAPNRRPWSGAIEVPIGPSERSIEIPVLAEEPAATIGEAPPPIEARPNPLAPEPAANPGSTQRTIGFVTAGVGVAALIAGGVFAFRAYDLNDQSLAQCRASDPNACTPRGKSLRDDARSSAAMSTAMLAAGGALTAAGVTLVLVAPSAERPNEARAALNLRTTGSMDGARVTLEGRF